MKEFMERERDGSKGFQLTMATRFLTLGAATIISCLLISMGMYQFRQARNLANAVSLKMDEFGRYLQEEELAGYDGVVMKGSDVVNFYRRYFMEKDAEFIMWIINGTGSHQFLDGEGLRELTEENGKSYCNPVESFLCHVVKNQNGVILQVNFETYQQVNQEIIKE